MDDDTDELTETRELVAPDGTVLGRAYVFKPYQPMSWYPSPECIAAMIQEA